MRVSTVCHSEWPKVVKTYLTWVYWFDFSNHLLLSTFAFKFNLFSSCSSAPMLMPPCSCPCMLFQARNCPILSRFTFLIPCFRFVMFCFITGYFRNWIFQTSRYNKGRFCNDTEFALFSTDNSFEISVQVSVLLQNLPLLADIVSYICFWLNRHLHNACFYICVLTPSEGYLIN